MFLLLSMAIYCRAGDYLFGVRFYVSKGGPEETEFQKGDTVFLKATPPIGGRTLDIQVQLVYPPESGRTPITLVSRTTMSLIGEQTIATYTIQQADWEGTYAMRVTAWDPVTGEKKEIDLSFKVNRLAILWELIVPAAVLLFPIADIITGIVILKRKEFSSISRSARYSDVGPGLVMLGIGLILFRTGLLLSDAGVPITVLGIIFSFSSFLLFVGGREYPDFWGTFPSPALGLTLSLSILFIGFIAMFVPPLSSFLSTIVMIIGVLPSIIYFSEMRSNKLLCAKTSEGSYIIIEIEGCKTEKLPEVKEFIRNKSELDLFPLFPYGEKMVLRGVPILPGEARKIKKVWPPPSKIERDIILGIHDDAGLYIMRALDQIREYDLPAWLLEVQFPNLEKGKLLIPTLHARDENGIPNVGKQKTLLLLNRETADRIISQYFHKKSSKRLLKLNQITLDQIPRFFPYSRESCARFYSTAQYLDIEDPGSVNGTFINGEDIRGKGRVRLKAGDEVSFAGILKAELIGQWKPTASDIQGLSVALKNATEIDEGHVAEMDFSGIAIFLPLLPEMPQGVREIFEDGFERSFIKKFLDLALKQGLVEAAKGFYFCLGNLDLKSARKKPVVYYIGRERYPAIVALKKFFDAAGNYYVSGSMDMIKLISNESSVRVLKIKEKLPDHLKEVADYYANFFGQLGEHQVESLQSFIAGWKQKCTAKLSSLQERKNTILECMSKTNDQGYLRTHLKELIALDEARERFKDLSSSLVKFSEIVEHAGKVLSVRA